MQPLGRELRAHIEAVHRSRTLLFGKRSLTLATLASGIPATKKKPR
jgi:hypothetical protein